jgi:hypothetical protein
MSEVSMRRITLVFPPMTMPTSPLLGVAMLKGFVERELPQWQVTVLDLNVWLFRFLLGGIARGEIHLTPAMHERMGADSRVLLQAVLPFFRGFNPYAQYLANFRDHALLVYDHFSAEALTH